MAKKLAIKVVEDDKQITFYFTLEQIKTAKYDLREYILGQIEAAKEVEVNAPQDGADQDRED